MALGFLSADNFLGGRMRLDEAAARAAVETVAQPLGMEAAAAAEGIVRIIDVKMAEAIKAIEFVPEYPTAPDLSQKVRAMMVATPQMRDFINTYMRNPPKR